MSLPFGAKIESTGIYLPEKRLTNFDFEKFMDTSNEWLVKMTGISERRIAADDEHTTDMGINAARSCLAKSSISPEELDMVILATYTPDRIFSAGACVIQDRIGAKNAAAFDIEVACSGFVYSLTIATQFVKSGMYEHVLIVASDLNSRFMNYKDRGTSILFGDGAAAVLISRCEAGEGVMESILGADGSGSEKLYLPAGGSRLPASHETVEKELHYMYMAGSEIFKWSTRLVPQLMDELLEKNGLTFDQIKLVVPHQANIRIIQSIAKRFKCDMDRFYTNLDKYGNTVAASIPIALHEALEEGRIQSGDYVMFVGFGGGLTWGGNIVKW